MIHRERIITTDTEHRWWKLPERNITIQRSIQKKMNE
jgi:hypothetical protein